MRRLRDMPALLGRAMRLLWRADRRTSAITAALQVLTGVGVAGQLVLGARVLRAIVNAGAERSSVASVIPELIALAAASAALGFATSALQGYNRLLAERTIAYFNRLILDVASAVDLEHFENASFYDRLQRARQMGTMTPLRISMGLVGITQAVVGVLGVAVALVAIEPVLVPLVIVGYLPLWAVAKRNSEEMYSFSFGNTPGDRLRQHLSTSLASREEAAEMRAFALSSFLLERWDRSYAERLADIAGIVRRHITRSLAASGVTSVLQASVFGVLVWLLLSGRTDIAAAATAAVAIQQMGARLQRVGEDAASVYESARSLEDFEAFLALRPADVPPPRTDVAPFGELRVDGLSFAYPGTDRLALDDVSLAIRAGEVIALVGENGSGKTTLAKLLAQLYRPTGGRILWDGVDTQSMPAASWRAHVAVIFQDFVRYRLSAAENVSMGDVERVHELAAVREAAAAAGADSFLDALPDGYDTVLAKEFEGGADLSVGQWQRVALARAFFRNAPFIVLDEPTAALDAKAEYELFETVRSLAGGRTVLLISHRFSSVRSADRILGAARRPPRRERDPRRVDGGGWPVRGDVHAAGQRLRLSARRPRPVLGDWVTAWLHRSRSPNTTASATTSSSCSTRPMASTRPRSRAPRAIARGALVPTGCWSRAAARSRCSSTTPMVARPR